MSQANQRRNDDDDDDLDDDDDEQPEKDPGLANARQVWRSLSDAWKAALTAERTGEGFGKDDPETREAWERLMHHMALAVEALENWAQISGNAPPRADRGRRLPEAGD